MDATLSLNTQRETSMDATIPAITYNNQVKIVMMTADGE